MGAITNPHKVLRLSALAASFLLVHCGQKQDYDRGEELEPAVLGGSGGSRTIGGQITRPGSGPTTKLVRRALPLPVYDIVPVTQIVEATSGILDWAQSDLPFTGAGVAIGDPVTDGQTPFHFAFDFPQNNYQFLEAHVVIDTARDSSDTEGIFVDGVLSGRPPANMKNTASPKVDFDVTASSAAAETNTYFIDYSLAHYKQQTRNTFDLQLADLLSPTSLTAIKALSDGFLPVATGDDSPVYQAYLVVRGLTIAGEALTCTDSDTYSFTNVYLHNDGNTVGEAGLSGTLGTPKSAWDDTVTYAGFEMYYDAPLPKVTADNITLSTAKLAVTAKRSGAAKSAIVINGIGVAETGFDTSTEPDVSWQSSGVATWAAFVASAPADTTGAAVELDLASVFGSDTIRDLLAQGKLNIAVKGAIRFKAAAATSTRTFGTAVSGPELSLVGTYFAEVCTVPDNPNSPLSQDGVTEPEVQYEWVEVPIDSAEGSGEEVINDGQGPVINSLQAIEITSTTATIVWTTDESASSQVRYGVGSLSSETAVAEDRTTFHQVHLTGLSPYKFYKFQVVSHDQYGNESQSDEMTFVTLR